jgi:hypothetical protein
MIFSRGEFLATRILDQKNDRLRFCLTLETHFKGRLSKLSLSDDRWLVSS